MSLRQGAETHPRRDVMDLVDAQGRTKQAHPGVHGVAPGRRDSAASRATPPGPRACSGRGRPRRPWYRLRGPAHPGARRATAAALTGVVQHHLARVGPRILVLRHGRHHDRMRDAGGPQQLGAPRGGRSQEEAERDGHALLKSVRRRLTIPASAVRGFPLPYPRRTALIGHHGSSAARPAPHLLLGRRRERGARFPAETRSLVRHPGGAEDRRSHPDLPDRRGRLAEEHGHGGQAFHGRPRQAATDLRQRRDPG
ncbi:maf-like protein Dgeo_1267 [Opitutia bacterium]|nr:maf-like protein Dgeo_1267 [Opitutae bacterium]